MTSRFHFYSHSFCSYIDSILCHSFLRSLKVGEAGGGTQITVLIPCEQIDVRKNSWENRRRGGLMPGTMEMPVNFGSNRLIPEFQLASIGWLDPVLRASRGSCCFPFFFLFNLCYYAQTSKLFNSFTHAEYPFP